MPRESSITMRKRQRKRRMMKWLGVATSVMLGAAWLASLRYNIWSNISPRYIVGVVGGCFLLEKVPPLQGLSRWPQTRPADPQYWWPTVNRAVYIQRTHWDWYIRIPIWCFLAVTLVPTIFLFYRDWRNRQRFGPHQCQKCGYNLTGNASGRCPECGEVVQLRSR